MQLGTKNQSRLWRNDQRSFTQVFNGRRRRSRRRFSQKSKPPKIQDMISHDGPWRAWRSGSERGREPSAVIACSLASRATQQHVKVSWQQFGIRGRREPPKLAPRRATCPCEIRCRSRHTISEGRGWCRLPHLGLLASMFCRGYGHETCTTAGWLRSAASCGSSGWRTRARSVSAVTARHIASDSFQGYGGKRW